ncbi:MAG: aminotransferase class V-fold PLP-dependent enzyme [Streptosporangiales bacterium]|nr:aminotransferase class V-fold PLP-dependent enzyme [Streptosporangiales bacterium]
MRSPHPQWTTAPAGYLNAPTIGLPPQATVEVLHEALDAWAHGAASAPGYDAAVQRSRELYADLVGVPESWVAVGPQVSVAAALVAAALPDGTEVVLPHGDFTSVVFPFLVHADRGVTVRHVPLARLADEIGPRTGLVAFSLVQSADGAIADGDAVREAAARVGARTFCDLTQAAGWLPVDASAYDVTAASGYKWLCQPRGTAFLTVRPELMEWIRPLHAGWYAGESRWDSTYGPEMTLASTARRYDVSPAWLSWVGAASALEVLTGIGVDAVHAHDTGLADALRTRIGLPPGGGAVVAFADPGGDAERRLREAGCAMSVRAGNVRMGFHLWNTEDDVDLAAKAIGDLSG